MTQVIADNVRANVTPTAPKSQRVCRHFARGRCTWGASCRFSHEVERPSVEDVVISPSYIGFQQQQIQKERHAILKAALEGSFVIKACTPAEGYPRYRVEFALPSSPIPIPRLFSGGELKAQLLEMDGNEQLRAGGLLYLVGEPAVFWSMMDWYRKNQTTTNSKWDRLLTNAKCGCVECMFFRSAAGCLSSECTFEHTAEPTLVSSPQLQNMATNNALLAPLLGFGAPATSATPSGAMGTNAGSVATVTAAGVGGSVAKSLTVGNARVPVDLTGRSSVVRTTEKTEETVLFSDPVWAFPSLSDTMTGPLSSQQQQQQTQRHDGLYSLWDDSARNRLAALW